MSSPESLIPRAEVEKSLKETPLEEITFLAHDVLMNGSVWPKKKDNFFDRYLTERVQVGYVNYNVKIWEHGTFRNIEFEDGDEIQEEQYNTMTIVREPPELPRKGKFLVETARWSIKNEPYKEWVLSRYDEFIAPGRLQPGREVPTVFPDVIVKTPWVKETLLAINRNRRGGFNG